jgi:hypothetical protein
MPIFLTTWETDTWRIAVRDRHRQTVHETPISTSSWAQWLHLSSQAMLESETWRIAVPGQPSQKSLWDPHLNGKKLFVVVHTCHLNYSRKH